MKYLLILFIFISCKTKISVRSQEMPEGVETISYEVEEKKKNPLFDAINALDQELIETTAINESKNVSLDRHDHSGTSPLTHFLIASAESEVDKAYITKKLLELGANPNNRTTYGLSPLSIAIQNNEVEVAKILLDKGADPKEVSDDGTSLKQLAEKLQRQEILELLKQYF